MQYLMDPDAMEIIAKEGLDLEVIPTPELRDVLAYAIEYYVSSGKTKAVSMLALETYEISMGRSLKDVLDDYEIDIVGEPKLEIRDIMSKLKSQYLLARFQAFSLKSAQEMAEAQATERLEVASQAASELVKLVTRLTPRRHHMEAGPAVTEALEEYQSRTATPDNIDGLGFGLREVDNHTLFIHPGELAILGAYAKVGKSWATVISALSEWRRGRTVTLFTLENSIAMTRDRLLCSAVGVDSTKWQSGHCSPDEIAQVMAFRDELNASPNKIHFMEPPSGQRTVDQMVRQAIILEADSVIIDQLSHIEHPSPRSKPRHEVVRDIMQQLHLAASTSTVPLPILVTAQISRDGKTEADRRGRHDVSDFAESSEVERSASLACTIYQSADNRQMNEALFQIVAARRVDIRSWLMTWIPAFGQAKIRGVV